MNVTIDKKKIAYMARRRQSQLTILYECSCIGPKENHHLDYSKPFEVERLCRDCHAVANIKMKYPNMAPFRFTKISEKIGISNSYLSQIYHGNVRPGKKVIFKLSEFTGDPVSWWKKADKEQIQITLELAVKLLEDSKQNVNPSTLTPPPPAAA